VVRGGLGIANAKNGISSHELGRALDVTQKSAWFMLHRVREAMRSGSFRKLAGTVETDETFVGGEARTCTSTSGRSASRAAGAVGKRVVHGMIQRGGEVGRRWLNRPKPRNFSRDSRR
jgi:hypothetical protein